MWLYYPFTGFEMSSTLYQSLSTRGNWCLYADTCRWIWVCMYAQTCMWMCVYMHYMQLYTCVYAHIDACTCRCLGMCSCVLEYACSYPHMCIYTQVYACRRVCRYMHVHLCRCTYVCVSEHNSISFNCPGPALPWPGFFFRKIHIIFRSAVELERLTLNKFWCLWNWLTAQVFDPGLGLTLSPALCAADMKTGMYQIYLFVALGSHLWSLQWKTCILQISF